MDHQHEDVNVNVNVNADADVDADVDADDGDWQESNDVAYCYFHYFHHCHHHRVLNMDARTVLEEENCVPYDDDDWRMSGHQWLRWHPMLRHHNTHYTAGEGWRTASVI